MDYFSLVYAPNEIFRKKANLVTKVDDKLRCTVDAMFKTMYLEKAVGLGANMVGILQRIVVVDLQENGKKQPLALINPEIIWQSEQTQSYTEASVCFPGIDAVITRPKQIKVTFLDYDGCPQEIEASDYLATVIQHEIDYLNGKIFLDYLSKLKQDSLIRKMKKHMKKYPPHIHGKHCNH